MRGIEIGQIKPTEIRPFFESLTEEELTSQKFLTEFILKKIGVGFRARDFNIKEGEYLPSKGLKIKIWPDELARFLLFIYEHRSSIFSYLELGTGSGGSFYVIDSYLRTVNPDAKLSITIDQKEKEPWFWKEYRQQNPRVTYLSMKTQDFYPDRHYDLGFIDANHSYKGVKRDYGIIKNHCTYLGFHDIATVNARKPDQICVRHLWEELEAKNKLEIITDDPRISFLSGIGVIWN